MSCVAPENFSWLIKGPKGDGGCRLDAGEGVAAMTALRPGHMQSTEEEPQHHEQSGRLPGGRMGTGFSGHRRKLGREQCGGNTRSEFQGPGVRPCWAETVQ